MSLKSLKYIIVWDSLAPKFPYEYYTCSADYYNNCQYEINLLLYLLTLSLRAYSSYFRYGVS